MSKSLVPTHLVWMMIVVAVCAAGCRTPSEPPAPREPILFPFTPIRDLSPMAIGDGRYADLFTPDSYALWLTREATAVKAVLAEQDGVTLTERMKNDLDMAIEHFVVIEVHLASMFGDQSIAYDAARLRGFEVYLETPQGRHVVPVITRNVGPLEETQADALTRFGRTHLIVFPKEDVFMAAPTVGPDTPAVRMVLEGYGSKYSFEWTALPPTIEKDKNVSKEDVHYYTRLGYFKLYQSIRRLNDVTY